MDRIMYTVRIKYNKEEYNLSADGGSLLDIIRKAGIPIGAPCGGKGTCEKCKVVAYDPATEVHGAEVLACKVRVDSNLMVEVPSLPQARILAEAYWPDMDIQWNEPRQEPDYGIAVDIGTTTVVVFLEDLNTHKNIATHSFLNPQSSYGADVITRIQAVMQQPEALREQKQLIVRAINDAIHRLVEENSLSGEDIRHLSIAGNTTMLHLLLGVDPSGLAVYPFAPAFLDEQTLSGAELGLEYCTDASVRLLPSLSAFVGADILAGMAATELTDDEEYSLYLDIGTNGEMALGNSKRIITCATAAGPAFEGAKISCGLGGVNGAIHSFDGKAFETIGSVPPSGLCGSGLVDAVAWLLNSKRLDSSGYLEEAVSLLEGEAMADGLPLQLTPLDIREVQLAKGAIAAGIQTLLAEAEISEPQVKRIFLAGGFGYALHVESAARIGLIPRGLKDKVIRAGNLAGLGARLALHSEDFIKRVNNIREKAEYFELSNHLGFNEAFVMEMNF